VSRIFLEEGKSASFPFDRNFRQKTGISKGLKKQIGNSGRKEGLTTLEFRGHRGYSILEFPKARGVEMFMPPMVGYGYYLGSLNSYVDNP